MIRRNVGNKMLKNDQDMKKPQQGSVLIEALVGILIFSMGVLALVGLQSAMVKNTSDAKYRADASFIAHQRLSSLWVNGENLDAWEEQDTDIGYLLPNGKRTTEIGDRRLATVTIAWSAPGDDADDNVVDGEHKLVRSTYIGVAKEGSGS